MRDAILSGNLVMNHLTFIEIEKYLAKIKQRIILRMDYQRNFGCRFFDVSQERPRALAFLNTMFP